MTFRIYYLVNVAEVKFFIFSSSNYCIEREREKGGKTPVRVFYFIIHVFFIPFSSSIKHIICHCGRIIFLAQVTERNGVELLTPHTSQSTC